MSGRTRARTWSTELIGKASAGARSRRGGGQRDFRPCEARDDTTQPGEAEWRGFLHRHGALEIGQAEAETRAQP